MPRVLLHRDATHDIGQLRRRQPGAVARLLAVLDEIATNPELVDRLTQADFGMYGTAPFHVSRWAGQQRQGRNLWRLKVWDLEQVGIHYRVVYAFEAATGDIYILGVTPRRHCNYTNDAFTRRVTACYDRNFAAP